MSNTIAAIATAPVKSAIGIIRISGEDTRKIVSQVFIPKYGKMHPRRMTFGAYYDAQQIKVDEGLCVLMPAPGSYTGEDTAELYCHGSLGVLQCVLDAVYRAGARPAEPGEFTKRAFLSGKMDLTQVEAVVDLIDSESREAARTAAAQLSGVLGGTIAAIRSQLVALTAHLCAVIDYPEDDLPPLLLEDAEASTNACIQEISRLLGSYERGALVKNGIPCAIVGKPNVGKSALLNALVGYERSIVTEIAGTTRDMVEEMVTIAGLAFRLQDTAGLRETSDQVEQIGISRAYTYAERAKLVLAVFDGSIPLTDEDRLTFQYADAKQVICVINKSDCPSRIAEKDLQEQFQTVVRVSAKTGEGIGDLVERMGQLFGQDVEYERAVLTNPRHVDALRRSQAALEQVRHGLQIGITADVLTVELESAINALGELTGQTASEAVMDGIFSRFCVGK